MIVFPSEDSDPVTDQTPDGVESEAEKEDEPSEADKGQSNVESNNESNENGKQTEDNETKEETSVDADTEEVSGDPAKEDEVRAGEEIQAEASLARPEPEGEIEMTLDRLDLRER